jgi:hypothetical protein
MPFRLDKPVAHRKEILVAGTARRAGGEVPPNRGTLIFLQRADGVRAEITTPFGAAVAHLLSFLPCFLPCFRAAASGTCQCGAGQYPQ